MLALPPEFCAAGLQKPYLSGPGPCRAVLLWNHEWRNPHVFKVRSLRCYFFFFGLLTQREAPVTCAPVHPLDGILGTLVGKSRPLTPSM